MIRHALYLLCWLSVIQSLGKCELSNYQKEELETLAHGISLEAGTFVPTKSGKTFNKYYQEYLNLKQEQEELKKRDARERIIKSLPNSLACTCPGCGQNLYHLPDYGCLCIPQHYVCQNCPAKQCRGCGTNGGDCDELHGCKCDSPCLMCQKCPSIECTGCGKPGGNCPEVSCPKKCGAVYPKCSPCNPCQTPCPVCKTYLPCTDETCGSCGAPYKSCQDVCPNKCSQ